MCHLKDTNIFNKVPFCFLLVVLFLPVNHTPFTRATTTGYTNDNLAKEKRQHAAVQLSLAQRKESHPVKLATRAAIGQERNEAQERERERDSEREGAEAIS